MTTSPNGQQPQQALASPQDHAAAWAQWHAQQAAVNAAAQQTMQAAGIVLQAQSQQMIQQVQPQLLPGIQIVGGDDNKSPMLGLSAYEKQGKCLRGSTLIMDPKTGKLVTISEIVKVLKADSRMLTMNAASLLVTTTPIQFFENQPQQLYRLKTQTGFEIEATAGHPFLTQHGWKPLKDLDLSTDRVVTIAEYPTEVFWGAGNGDDEAKVKVLAYLIADGALQKSSNVFTKQEDEVREDFIEAVEAMGDRVRVYKNDKGIEHVAVAGSGGKENRVLKWIRDAGLSEHTAAEKFIPSFVFHYPRNKMALFLNRLFTCDGSVEAAGKLSYSSTSFQLIRQVRHLLARFGIVATVREKYLDDALYGAEVLISSRANVLRFIDEIGFFGAKQLKAEMLRERLSTTTTAGGQAGDETQLWKHGPYLFDRIKSIEATVVEATFDIEIADSHNFVANDFVVHNSTTAITSLIDWPSPGMHPLCIAWDPHGPDACVRLGYYPHVIRIRDQPGNSWMDKARSVMRMLHTNRDVVQRRYGSLVIDCASTCAMALHTDAQKLPKNANNPDTRAPYADSTLYLKEHINAVIDVGLPNIWLSWLMEGHIDSQKEEGSTQNRKTTRLGGPDIMGSKMRNFIAGKSHHNFILEKYKAKTDPWGRACDDEGSVRVFHSKPWGLLNAGGRYSHVLPDPCPASFGWVLSQITGRGPYAPQQQVRR